MGDSTANKIYSDLKRTSRKILKIILVLIVIIASVSAIDIAYDKYKSVKEERRILDEAINFSNNHQPYIFERYDFDNKSYLYVWITLDTDNRTIIKIDDKYAVFYSDFSDPSLVKFSREAGDICNYASASVNNGKVFAVNCGKLTYLKKPER